MAPLDIRLITSTKDLDGTQYFELMPGAYRGRCWNEGSIFIDEEVFGFLEPIFECRVPAFNHYAFSQADSTQCAKLASDLTQLAEQLDAAESMRALRSQLGFVFTTSEARFLQDFLANKVALAALARAVATWIRVCADRDGGIAVLGI
ncbi:hypothetical protein IP84_12480 [beta proteobacterium AAP99]|nr:hypothetical protein IP84_12480 [beta proteobacterium AAP99]